MEDRPNDSSKQSADLAWKIVFTLVGILSSVAFGLSSIMWGQVQDIEDSVEGDIEDVATRVTVIESSRCTADMCANLVNSVTKLELLYAQLPKEVPPQWFQSQVDKNTIIGERLSSDIETLKQYCFAEEGVASLGDKGRKK